MLPLLTPRTWDSKSALLAFLEATEATTLTLLLGKEAEAPRSYHSFSFRSGHGRADIGLISSDLGTEPAAILLDEERRLLVGHDTQVTWIDTEAFAVVSSRRLPGVFYEFLSVESDDEIVILHELGLVRVDGNATEKWALDTDVVEGWTTDESGHLSLTVMDGPKLLVSLTSGAVVS